MEKGLPENSAVAGKPGARGQPGKVRSRDPGPKTRPLADKKGAGLRTSPSNKEGITNRGLPS